MAEPSYYVRARGRIMGPFNPQQLKRLRDQGQLSRFHDVSTDRKSWMPATHLVELFPAPESVAEAPSTAPMAPPAALALPTPGYEPPFSAPNYTPRATVRGKWTWLWVLAAVVTGGLTALSVVLWLVVPWVNKGSLTVLAGRTIGSPSDEKAVAGAVGLTVPGAHVTRSDGSQYEIPFGTGTCFSITDQGFLFTNKHVIEKVHNLQHAAQPITALRKEFKDDDITRAVLKVWVFFGNEKYDAEIKHVSNEYDFAVLKIARNQTPFFRLSGTEQWPRGKKVFALGYPGAARKTIFAPEEIALLSAGPQESVREYFKPRDFEFGSTDGTIGRVFTEGNSARHWIEHNASISPGNSGGPLVDEAGLVLGINTAGPPAQFQAQGIFWAISLRQLKKEIQKHVGDVVVWD